MKTELNTNETLIKKGAANLKKGIETVGGYLYLTSQRLIFEAHAVNFRGGNTIIDLSNIDSTEKCWTKFLNLIPLMPNSLAINSKTGEEYKFVLFRRNAWEVKINENIS
jgi:hypothetical protein|tara:strand:+ start:42 stop:368 length:327 start_codon:yes stop_codon:yes gene_type:complete